MRVLLASSSSGSRGGGELFLLYLAQGLVALGHRVTLWAASHARMDELAGRFRGLGEVVRAPYVNTYDRPGRSLAAYLDRSTARRVAAQWRALAVDVVHVNKQNLEDGLELLAAGDSVGQAALCTIHLTQSATRLGARAAGFRDLVARRALRKSRMPLVAVVESRKLDLERFLGRERQVEVVRNGVPVQDLNPRREASRRDLSVRPDDLVVVGVGRLVGQKRPLKFLDALTRLRTAHPRLRGFWVGDGPLRSDWDRYVTDHDLASIASCVGWQEDVAPYLAAADLFVHVAEYEGLPLALLEAMAAGLPCVVTENLQRELGFLTNETSLRLDGREEWVATVGDPESRRRIGAAGRRTVESSFSSLEMARQYQALYARVQRG
jgi:glycosyltransferase involved in cell wall biosynthesis